MGSLTVPEDVRWSLLQEGGYKSLSLRPAEVWQFELPPVTLALPTGKSFLVPTALLPNGPGKVADDGPST